MKVLLFFIYGLVIAALESVFRLPGDFLLLTLIFLAFEETLLFALFFAVLYGIFTDVLSYAPMGATLFPFLLIFLGVRLMRNTVHFKDRISRFSWVTLFSLVAALLGWGYLAMVDGPMRPFSAMLRPLLVTPLLNGLIAVIWIPCLEWYGRLTTKSFIDDSDGLLKKR